MYSSVPHIPRKPSASVVHCWDSPKSAWEYSEDGDRHRIYITYYITPTICMFEIRSFGQLTRSKWCRLLSVVGRNSTFSGLTSPCMYWWQCMWCKASTSWLMRCLSSSSVISFVLMCLNRSPCSACCRTRYRCFRVSKHASNGIRCWCAGIVIKTYTRASMKMICELKSKQEDC